MHPDGQLARQGPRGSGAESAGTSPSQAAPAVLAWQNTDLRPISPIEVVGETGVLYIVVNKKIHLAGLDLATGEQRWRMKVSASRLTPGVGLRVFAADGRVAAYVSSNDTLIDKRYREDWVHLVVIDASTGKVVRRDEKNYYFDAMPEACAEGSNRACASGSSGSLRHRMVEMNLEKGTTTFTSAAAGDSIGEHGLVRLTGGKIARLDKGKRLWSIDLTDALGKDYSTNFGWTFTYLEDEDIFVGQVGSDRSKKANRDMTRTLVFALNASTGSLVWKRPGVDLSCQNEATDHDVLLVCAQTGQTDIKGVGTQISTAVARLQPATGEVVWQTPVIATGDKIAWEKRQLIVPLDGSKAVASVFNGTAHRIDVESGAVADLPAEVPLWIQTDGP